MRLQVANSTTTVYYSITNAVPAKPYLQISNQYLPLTTATLAGIKLKVQSGNTTYRACTYQSGYYNTTSAAVGNLSSTTALTRASTSATLTRASTSATLTRASTSATLTRASTSATLTRASTSATLTRASTSATLTRASTSATLTRASTSATLTRASTSATLTRSSISGYGTATTTSATTETWWNYSGTYDVTMTTAAIFSGTALVDGKTCTLASCYKYTLSANTNTLRIDGYNFQATGTTYGYPGDGNFSMETVNYAETWLYRSSSGWDTKPYIFYTCTFTDGKSYTLTMTTTNTHGSGWEDGNPQRMQTYRYSFTNSGNNRPPTYLVNQNFGTTTAAGWAAYIRAYSYRNWASSLSNNYNRTSSYGMPVFKSNGAYYTSVTLTITYKHCFSEVSVAGSWRSLSVRYNKRVTQTTATLTRSSISGYATRSSISGYATRSSISGYGTRSSISGYATRSSASGYQTRSSISGYGTRSSISGYGTTSSISGYATRSSVSGYGTRSSISGYSGKLSSSKWA